MNLCIDYPELLDLSNELLFVLDSDFNILCANKIFFKKTGLKLPASFLDFIDEVDYSEFSSCIKNFSSSKRNELRLAFNPPNVDTLILNLRFIVRDDSHIVCNASDHTKLRKLEREKYKIEYFDEFTGIYNRRFIRRWLGEFFSRPDTKNYAFISCELDGLVLADDIYGYEIGDKLLLSAIDRIKSISSDSDIIGRLTNGTICIIKKTDNIDDYVKVLLQTLNTSFDIHGLVIDLAFHVGITIIPKDANTVENCLRYTNFAVDMIRQKGKVGCHAYFLKEFLTQELDKAHFTNEIKNAIYNNELVLFYQPKIDLKSKKLSGFEALIRWQHPERGLLTPDKFIQIAEDENLIVEMGNWIIEAAFKQSIDWSNNLRGSESLKIAINLSVKQLNKNLILQLKQLLTTYSIKPENIEFEVTETLFAGDNIKEITKILQELRNMGFSIAIDDFGTGYSSFFYLKNMGIDTLKIDRAFVQEIPNNTKDTAITRNIINVAHDLGYKVVAEGVETLEQEDFLRDNDCDYSQGYLFSKPLSPEKATEFILE